MKRISLVLCLVLMLVAMFTISVFAATQTDITADARFEQNGSTSDLLDIELVRDGDYTTASSCVMQVRIGLTTDSTTTKALLFQRCLSY